VKSEVEADLESLKKALEDTSDESGETISAAAAKLAESSQKMGSAMYAANEAEGATAGAGSEGAPEGSDDDVVDAEIIDDDQQKGA